MKFDLHMHSNASSDGQLTPAQLVAMAKDLNMEVIALSDHDTVANVAEITALAAKEGIEVLPAIEVSTLMGDWSVHLLGYGIDLDDPWINSLAAKAEAAMRSSFHTRVEKLCNKYGLTVDEEDILLRAGESNPWFTLMDDIFQSEEARSIADFQDYLPGGKRSSPAAVNFYWDKCMPGSDLYVKASGPDLKESIARIHKAGGVAVIAHPFRTFYQKEDVLEDLIESGLDGLEVYSNYHDPKQTAWYRQFAEDHGLLMTCGSDFHGEKKPDIVMGDYHLQEDGTPLLMALKQAMKDKRS